MPSFSLVIPTFFVISCKNLTSQLLVACSVNMLQVLLVKFIHFFNFETFLCPCFSFYASIISILILKTSCYTSVLSFEKAKEVVTML